jgi:protein ImuB
LLVDSMRTVIAALPGRPPVVIADLERNGKVVRACDERAATAGVRAGMAINSALALLPSLHTLARDTRRERQLLEAIARRGLNYTPRVSLEPPDGVLFEVRGSLRLFGGARRLCELLQADLIETTGATVRFAITPTPLASLWLARQAETAHAVLVRRPEELPSRLAALPLACTRWPERSQQALGTMGVRTIGACLRLPRDGFARRFGAALLTMLDRATGRLPEPRAAFAAREKFATRRDLEPETGDTERLGRALQPLLAELCGYLRERGRAVQAIEVQLRHRDAATTRVRLRFMQPMGAQPQRIAELLRERLARVALPQPVCAVRLVSGPLVEMTAVPVELFADDRRESGANVPQLVERLRARLGVTAVHGLACVPEHRPEAAWRAIEPALQTAAGHGNQQGRREASAVRETAGTSAHQAGLNGMRPLWLLDEPQCCTSRLEFEDGPECIESGWWDGHDIARDYYVARNAQGMRLWVFRNRRSADAHGWFIHGYFG